MELSPTWRCWPAILLSRPGELASFHKILPAALLLCFLYWQVIPVLLTSMGASLDLRKLLVYPIPKRALFAIEVILRISTGVEMLLILTGARHRPALESRRSPLGAILARAVCRLQPVLFHRHSGSSGPAAGAQTSARDRGVPGGDRRGASAVDAVPRLRKAACGSFSAANLPPSFPGPRRRAWRSANSPG